jgi:hypothetical protein
MPFKHATSQTSSSHACRLNMTHVKRHKPHVSRATLARATCHTSRVIQVLGKPEPLLLELLMNANDPPLQPNRTIMVGDRSARPKLACVCFHFCAFFRTACALLLTLAIRMVQLLPSSPSPSHLPPPATFPPNPHPVCPGHRHTVWAGWGSTHPPGAPHYLFQNALALCFRGYDYLTFPPNFQVLTGVATLDNARAAAAGAQPHHVTQSLGDVAALYADD